MKRSGITLIELIMSIAIFALVLTSLVSFLFTIQDAARTQTVAHDVLSFHREVTYAIDAYIRSASSVDMNSSFLTPQGSLILVDDEMIPHSFALSKGSLVFTSSTESVMISSRRVDVDYFLVQPVSDTDHVIGVTYSIGVRSSAPDERYRVDTTSTVLFRAQP